MTDLIASLQNIVGTAHVLTDDTDRAPYERDATQKFIGKARAVVRPANTGEVSAILRLANETGTPVVPQGGNTSLAGGTFPGDTGDAIVLSLARLNRIHEIRPESRIAIVEAGVILAKLHEACDQHGLIFPLTLGARGTALIGGNLSTNAGGSNVVRYGNTRDLVLGIEAVMPNGDIVDLMSELHKDNTGYNLKHLLIGAEGTLGVITGAVLKLAPKPRAYFTAMIAVPDIPTSLGILNDLRGATGNGVEAFEYMPQRYFEMLCDRFPETRMPFEEPVEHGIFIEVGLTSPDDVAALEDGSLPGVNRLEAMLMEMLEREVILDAVICKTEGQRREMWERRERAYDAVIGRGKSVDCDISLPVDGVETFLARMDARLPAIAPDATTLTVSHLGDGNLHYSIWTDKESRGEVPEALQTPIMELVEETVQELRGSFSAEHGIGLLKLPSMARRKDANALSAMRAIKAALDPNNIMNPGKVLPPAD